MSGPQTLVTYSKETRMAWVCTKVTTSRASQSWYNQALRFVYSARTLPMCPNARRTLAVTVSQMVCLARVPSATQTRASFISSKERPALPRQLQFHRFRTLFLPRQETHCDQPRWHVFDGTSSFDNSFTYGSGR